MSQAKFSTAKEWADFYREEARRLVDAGGLGSSKPRAVLRERLAQTAAVTLDSCMLKLEDSEEFGMTVVTSGAGVFHIPPMQSVGRKMITNTGIVLFARKVLTLYGLADSAAVGEYYQQMSAESDRQAELSDWFSSLLKEGIADYLRDRREGQLDEWWNQGDMTDRLKVDLVSEIGEQAATEIMTEFANVMPFISFIYKGYCGASSPSERLAMAATILRERALYIHKKLFIEMAASSRLLRAPSSSTRRKLSLRIFKNPNSPAPIVPPASPNPPPTSPNPPPTEKLPTRAVAQEAPDRDPPTDEEAAPPGGVPFTQTNFSSTALKSTTAKVFYWIFRTSEVICSFSLLGMTCQIIATGIRPPSAIQFFLFSALWSILIVIYRGVNAYDARYYSRPALASAEWLALIFTFAACVTYAVGLNQHSCLNGSWADLDVLGYADYPWGVNSGYSSGFDMYLLRLRCNEEVASCVFFWFLLTSYVGLIVTVVTDNLEDFSSPLQRTS